MSEVQDQVMPETAQAILTETGWGSIEATDESLTFTLSGGTKIHVFATDDEDSGNPVLSYKVEPQA